MKPWSIALPTGLATLLLVVGAEVIYLGWSIGRSMVRMPLHTRRPMLIDPGQLGLAYENVVVTTSDGVVLRGWFIPGDNGATIIAQHGYRGDRTDLLFEAAFLNAHGYNVLMTSVRGHDLNEEEQFSWGKLEIRDMEAWYVYLLNRDDVHPDLVGMLGESFGGALAITYGAQNEGIRAVAALSTYAEVRDILGGSLAQLEKQGLPAWLANLFVPFIVWSAQTNMGVRVEELRPVDSIADLSPRPVLIGHGGQDAHVPVESGRRLFAAAGEPKLIWEEAEARHNLCNQVDFHEACQAQLLSFFDRYLGENRPGVTGSEARRVEPRW
jgi:uncharacterized protein